MSPNSAKSQTSGEPCVNHTEISTDTHLALTFSFLVEALALRKVFQSLIAHTCKHKITDLPLTPTR